MKWRLRKIEDVSQPKNGLFQIYVNHFWIVEGNSIVFYAEGGADSPQCNDKEEIAKAFRDKIHPDREVKQIPVVYLPINPRDYC